MNRDSQFKKHWDVLQHLVTHGGTHTYGALQQGSGYPEKHLWGSVAYLMKHKLIARNFNTSGGAEYFATPMAAQFKNLGEFQAYYTEHARLRGKGAYKHRVRKPGGNGKHHKMMAPRLVTKRTFMAPRPRVQPMLSTGSVKVMFEINGTAVTWDKAKAIYTELKGVFE